MQFKVLFTSVVIIALATVSCTNSQLDRRTRLHDPAGGSNSDETNPEALNGSGNPESNGFIDSNISDDVENISSLDSHNPADENQTPIEPEDPERVTHTLTLMISSNTVSTFTPCGCRSGKWGGMPRRGTIFSKIEDEVEWPIVFLDTGNITLGSSTEMQRLKDDYIFQAYGVMDYDFINVGINDLKLGYDELARIENEYGITWTSLNTYAVDLFPDILPDIPSGVNTEATTERDSGIPVIPPGTHTSLFQPYKIIEPDGLAGFKIGLIGAIIHPSARLNPLFETYSFEQYVDAVPRTVEYLRTEENVDLIILVSDADTFDNTRLDEITDGIDMVIGGVTQLQVSPNAVLNPGNPNYNSGLANLPGYQENDSFLMLPPLPQPLMVPKAKSRGRLVHRLEITVSETGRIVDYYLTEMEVSDAYDDDPRMDRIARGYDTNVLSVELIAKIERSYTGSDTCEQCHQGYTRAWSDHGHFQAYRTIADDGSLSDRECTRCHAIGFMEEPRLLTYDLVPEHLRNVGCEGCHPNGQTHITLQNLISTLTPEELEERDITDAMGVATNVNICTKCHTGEWAEGFNYDEAIDAARAICQSVD